MRRRRRRVPRRAGEGGKPPRESGSVDMDKLMANMKRLHDRCKTSEGTASDRSRVKELARLFERLATRTIRDKEATRETLRDELKKKVWGACRAAIVTRLGAD
jgi:hypothetical protein